MTNLYIDNAFKLEVAAKQIISIESLEGALSLGDLQLGSYLVLGSATNMIMSEFYDGTIIKVSMSEIEQISEEVTSVGAGLSWDQLISYCIDNNLFGIENLTLIPGSVGAAPVQNIGAYGVEISSVIESVTCYNFTTKQIETLTKAECDFSYRHSIFQTKQYLILSVQFRFHKLFKPDLSYPSLVQFLERENISSSDISPAKLSTYIQAIRESKLPSPNVIPNVGSIFKNPVVKTSDYALDLLAGHRWDQKNNFTKFSAARLIELIYKDLKMPKSLGFHENHKLVLINNGNATFDEIVHLLDELNKDKYTKNILRHLANDNIKDGSEILAAELATNIARYDFAIQVSKIASYQKRFHNDFNYPIISTPQYVNGRKIPETAFILSLIRQESEFDMRANSHVGAQGLMQLMPYTAKLVAKQAKLPYSKSRLTSDPEYNINLGSHYIAGLILQYDGAYPFATAAYNAGPKRVKYWKKINKDPQKKQVDFVDWVELIKFKETRNYVQRVMENYNVYRYILEKKPIKMKNFFIDQPLF